MARKKTNVPSFPIRPPDDLCSLCRRQVPADMLTKHHLKPRERGGTAEHTTPMCRPCHKQLHAIFSNRQLDEFYDSVETLRSLPQLQPFLKWIRKQPAETSFKTRQAGNHPDRRRRK
jgi:5-methylcytosine-specific restriction enzyme A